MSKSIAELNKIIEELELKLAKRGKGKKDECLELLRGGYDTIASISESMGIKNTNVSSLFSYLRKDGYLIEKIKAGGNNIIIFGEIGDALGVVKKDV